MGAKEERLRNLRRRCFQRDGWQDDHGDWFAMCAMPGCEAVMSWRTSGIGYYPIPHSEGGRRVLENTRLLCHECGSHGRIKLGKKRVRASL